MASHESRAHNTQSPEAPGGDDFDRLLEKVYRELRHIAHFHNLNESNNFTLQTTALVHEAYLRLAEADQTLLPQDAHHLKTLTSRIIRRLLVDQARQRRAACSLVI